MDFGERIKYLRENAGLNQAELARKLNAKRGTVSAWEAGVSLPHIALLKEAALLFHVSTDFLLGLEREEFLSIDDLSKEQKAILRNLIACLSELSE